MEAGNVKETLQNELRKSLAAGAIDVNIMSKLDKTNYGKNGAPLAAEHSDALASLRGFANSELDSSVVFSAGYNPRLYAYVERQIARLIRAKGARRQPLPTCGLLRGPGIRKAPTLLPLEGLAVG